MGAPACNQTLFFGPRAIKAGRRAFKPVPMSFLFGGAWPSGADSVRDYQRKVASSARGLQREIARIDSRETAAQRELARCVQQGRLEEAKAKATDMVRGRAHRERLAKMAGHMAALGQQLQGVHSAGKMQEMVVSTGRILQGLNSRLDAGSLARALADYERQLCIVTGKTEVVDDALEGVFEVDGEEDATQAAVCAVLEEAGLDVSARLPQADALAAEGPSAEQLAERLQRLRSP